MKISLQRASVQDAETLWHMQREAFAALYGRYRDTETSPAVEPLEKTIRRLMMPETWYYFILADHEIAGAIRVLVLEDRKRISPIFILPAFQGRGIAQGAIREAERLHGDTDWELDTILEEPGNCHLYEKLGYRQTGETRAVNEKMTLVFYRK